MPTIQPRTYEPTAPLNLAFLGLGVMGYPMAGHLARAGHRVTVYNRTASKSAAFCAQLQDTGRVASVTAPAQAAAGADIVFACVGNDDDLRQVTLGRAGAFAGMKVGAIFADHTTASARLARELDEQARQRGLHFMDAPVSGGQAGAESGALTVMCGGDAVVFERVKPVVLAYARAVTRMGEVGAGQLTKMVNQICLCGVLQALSEAIAFGERTGLPIERVLEVIGKGAAQSWQIDNRGHSMAQGRFDFGFAVDWMRKDLGLVLDEARRNGAHLPLTALVDQFYGDVQAMGGGRWDTSSLIARLRDVKKG
jgi:3-hydroxyisobutyrate dehydrogenase-like beta-hydroxyacid dehydrogenase